MGPVSMGTTPDGIGTNNEARKDRLHPSHDGLCTRTPSLTEDSPGANTNNKVERRLRAQAQLRVRLEAAKRAANANAVTVVAGHEPPPRSYIDSGRVEDEDTRSTREGKLREALLARNRSGETIRS